MKNHACHCKQGNHNKARKEYFGNRSSVESFKSLVSVARRAPREENQDNVQMPMRMLKELPSDFILVVLTTVALVALAKVKYPLLNVH